MTFGFVAHVVFWAVLLVDRIWGESDWLRTAVFVALWVVGYFGSNWFQSSGFVFGSYVAVLDIVLVLMVFKGDALRL